jgi:hypothetical protein
MKASQTTGWSDNAIESASDDELREDLAAYLRAIEAILGDYDTRPSPSGLAPPDWHARVSRIRGDNANRSAVERYERHIQAIWAELPKRELERREAAAAAKADAQRRLAEAVTIAPQAAAELAQQATAVAEASERVRCFIRDLQAMGGGTQIAEAILALQRGTKVAAEALDKPAPTLPEMPNGLPTTSEINRVMAALTAGRGFDALPNLVPGDLRHAEKLAAILKN